MANQAQGIQHGSEAQKRDRARNGRHPLHLELMPDGSYKKKTVGHQANDGRIRIYPEGNNTIFCMGMSNPQGYQNTDG